ncbi:unnamed protein product [Soboliphyme baturini]|uniref:BPI2 domain-containing protein n=1 Tax=Soboliphyme baturini TaxID=241478 RepID=A0A183ISE6_9BILA|nr:unnamed protein product [Soboliphyme baturini]
MVFMDVAPSLVRWLTALVVLAIKGHSREVTVTFNASKMNLQVEDSCGGSLLKDMLTRMELPPKFSD